MLTDKEKMELMNLRTRVVNQKAEIKRLTEQIEELKAEMKDAEKPF